MMQTTEGRIMRVVPFVNGTPRTLWSCASSHLAPAPRPRAFKLRSSNRSSSTFNSSRVSFRASRCLLGGTGMKFSSTRCQKGAPACSGSSSTIRRCCRPSRSGRWRSVTTIRTPSRTVGPRRCGKACYECLLDYANQPDHRELDRSLIRDTLAGLARAECRPAGGEGSRAERLSALRRRCDSRLEERWLDLVDELGLRLPSDAQYRIPAYATQPDFYYGDAHAAIYIDGPPHDTPHQVREDDATTETLIGMGYIVIRFHHEDDWLAIFRRHADVFGTPTPSSAP